MKIGMTGIRLGFAAGMSLWAAMTAPAAVEWTYAGGRNNFLEKILSAQTGTNAVKKAGPNTLVFHLKKDKFVESLKLDFKGLHPWGYYMVKRGNDIALVGSSFAIPDFLKRFTGYRSFGGGPFGDVIPKIDKLDLPAEFTYREEPDVASVWIAGDAYWDSLFARSWRRVDKAALDGISKGVDDYEYLYALNTDRMAPACYTHVIADRLRKLHKESRIKTYWQELYPDSMIFDAGRQYVVNELLWNMDADVDALLDDYHRSMFGPAAKAMRRFSDTCEEAYTDNPERKPTDFFAEWKSPVQFNGYTFARLDACDAALREAAAAVKPGSTEAWRISLIRKVWSAMRPLMDAWQCRRALEKAEDAKEIMRLARQGLADLAAFKAVTMTPDEQSEVFYGALYDPFLRWKAQAESTFEPLSPLELAIDGALGRLVKTLGTEKAKTFLGPLAKDPALAPYAVTALHLLDHHPVALDGKKPSPAEPRTRYRLSCRVKVSQDHVHSNGSVGICLKDGRGERICGAGTAITHPIPRKAAEGWVEMRLSFTTPDRDGEAFIAPVFTPAGPETADDRLLVEDVRFEKLCEVPWNRGKFVDPVVTVTFTFDDQTRDQLKAAALLEKYGWRGCFNVITKSVAANENKMTWDEIRDLKRRGHEIASHTYSHESLTKLLREGGRDKVMEELVRSRDDIARETGSPPRFLCHPYIAWDSRVNALVREAGMTPYWHDRCVLGTDTKAGTPKSVGAILDRRRSEGKLKADLLTHGVEPGGGWNPFASVEEFEAALKEVKAREQAGTVRVVSYDEFIQ